MCRVLGIPVPEVVLHRSQIRALIGQIVAAEMAQHVRPNAAELCSLASDPHDAQIARLAECATAVIGRAPKLYREHFASDARFYSDIGVPSVCFGPVGAGLHSDEEWVEIDSLVQLYQVLWRFVTE